MQLLTANPEDALSEYVGRKLASRRSILAGTAAGTAGLAAAVMGPGSSTPALAGTSGQWTTLEPSGDTTGKADTQSINDALQAAAVVQLLPPAVNTPYYVNAPIVVPSYTMLTGGFPWHASSMDGYGPPGQSGILNVGGTLIVAVPAFSGSAVIEIVNTGTVEQGGQVLQGFTIEGNELPPKSGIYGIWVNGAVAAGYIMDVMVHRTDGNCLRMDINSTTGYVPDDWRIIRFKASGCRNNQGIYLNYCDDTWFTDCESSESDGDNWYINHGVNTRFTGCKAENSFAGGGFHFGGLGAGQNVLLTECTTHLNYADGFFFDNSGNGGLGTYQLANCSASQDGRAGGTTFAGYRSVGCLSRIMATGCTTLTDSIGPAFGAAAENHGYGMCHTGGSLAGVTAALHDDGLNTHALVSQSAVPF